VTAGIDKPLVSVLMASFQHAPFVAEAVESVLGQTYPHVELVAVDDRSSDGTPDVIAGYARRHPDSVRLVAKRVREGPIRARAEALALARGSLICWLDSDDLWLPDKVAEQVDLMTARPEVGLAYTYFDAFDSDSGKSVPWGEARSGHEGDVLVPLFVDGCFIGSLTAMFRRVALDRRRLGFYDRFFSFGDDYYFWLVIALDWEVAVIPRVLARYRRHAGNESEALMQRNIAADRLMLLRDFLAAFPEARARLGRNRRIGLALNHLRAAAFERSRGQNLTAAGHKARALAQDPRWTTVTEWRAMRGRPPRFP
jgi:glycosyltransferase involved in cell wall biosynthesis